MCSILSTQLYVVQHICLIIYLQLKDKSTDSKWLKKNVPDNKLKRGETGTWSGSGTAASRFEISLSQVLLNDVADQ